MDVQTALAELERERILEMLAEPHDTWTDQLKAVGMMIVEDDD